VTAMAELIERAAPAGGSLAAQAGPGDRDGAGSPVVRLGDGPGLTVLVPDGTGTLAAYQALREALAGRTALAGLIAIDRAEYLATGSKTLIDVIAAGYTEALIQAGCQRPRLVGHGFGGIVAAEVARQLAEAGTPVGSLLVIAAAPAPAAAADDWLAECLFWRELGLGAEAEARRSCSPAERFRQLAELAPGVPLEAAREVFQHSSQAAAVHELLPYAGDITLVRPQPSPWWPSLRADLASYWTECCLGDLEIVDLACPDTGCVRTAATDLANLVTRDHAR
jgi:pyochelin synthetase